MHTHTLAHTLTHTHTHTCVQVMNHESYGEGVDIWGTGCIGFEMMTLDFLWERFFSFFLLRVFFSVHA